MNERNMSIVFSSGISSLVECNSSFDQGVLRVCYTGRNRNNSFISKDTFERCMSSIYNCPIVCRYDRDTDMIGSHDMELVADEDGNMRIVNVTHPVGVIPTNAKYWWEEIEDDSGLHEYLCVDALLWKRQEAYKKIKEDGITDESMEISVKEGEMVDGVYVIKRFEFTAFCLLGTAQPCYESASLEVFSKDDFKQQLAEMMQEFKECFSMVQPSLEEVDINQKNYSEGGEGALEEKIALMEEFELTEDMLDFSLEDFDLEELRVKFEEIKEANKPAEVVITQEEAFALAEQFREELVESMSTETIETCFGEMARYGYVDYDSELNEVYCYDYKDWKLYGFAYSMNGDNVQVDFESKKRMKFAIVDFDEGEQPALFEALFDKAVKAYEANDSMWSEKYQSTSEAFSEMEEEVESLRQFKAGVEHEEAKQKRDELFACFEDLAGNEAFEALRESSMEFELDVLEEKCYAIRGRLGATAKFSFNEPQKAPKLPVEKPVLEDDDPYGGVFQKYNIV